MGSWFAIYIYFQSKWVKKTLTFNFRTHFHTILRIICVKKILKTPQEKVEIFQNLRIWGNVCIYVNGRRLHPIKMSKAKTCKITFDAVFMFYKVWVRKKRLTFSWNQFHGIQVYNYGKCLCVYVSYFNFILGHFFVKLQNMYITASVSLGNF